MFSGGIVKQYEALYSREVIRQAVLNAGGGIRTKDVMQAVDLHLGTVARHLTELRYEDEIEYRKPLWFASDVMPITDWEEVGDYANAKGDSDAAEGRTSDASIGGV